MRSTFGGVMSKDFGQKGNFYHFLFDIPVSLTGKFLMESTPRARINAMATICNCSYLFLISSFFSLLLSLSSLKHTPLLCHLHIMKAHFNNNAFCLPFKYRKIQTWIIVKRDSFIFTQPGLFLYSYT